ncbi:MAG: NAD(P)-binding domain-containing protein [Myxococcales bacterium]|nr:NAD(P)-binding domain-containing protein [Myxococcales bacterium]
MRIGVVGGGEFGRGLATTSARAGHEVLLWSRRGGDLQVPRVKVTGSVEDLADRQLIFLAVPSPHVTDTARHLGPTMNGEHVLVHVSRGLVGEQLETLSHVLRSETPCRRVGALGGPLMARALTADEPCGVILGTRFPEVEEAVRAALDAPTIRIERTDDILGVEISSALVGLIALGTGYALGHGATPDTLALYVTRGAREAVRVVTALGGRPETFSGLAGFGDLVAAVAGDGRPEIRLGMALAKGLDLDRAGVEAGAYIEGVFIARRVANFAKRAGIRTPIAGVMADVVDGTIRGKDAIAALSVSL